MARLHEHQGKALLKEGGIRTPRGGVATSPEAALSLAREIGCPVMVKAQAWTTSRAASGGIAKARTPEEARDLASKMLALRFGSFPVTEILIEECVPIARELFASLAIAERERAPVLLLSASGGSGVEERAATTQKVPCHVRNGPDGAALSRAVASLNAGPKASAEVERVLLAMFTLARTMEARSLEINPLAITEDGRVIAADCRIAIDDYAVARHPELGIEIAREFDHPPTPLERTAYRYEQEDHRGTFFFAQMATAAPAGSKGLVGFHGAGGGGSMMSMDAINTVGFTLANFCDTSGNPSPAKVYRAARVILSQPGLIGYFGSGSGVANQEQFWSAYGLAKAFWEMDLDIPAVIRLGGNAEDRAVDILESSCKAAGLRATVEGYRKFDSPAKVAERFAALVAEQGGTVWKPRAPRRPAFVGNSKAAKFQLKNATLWIDRDAWKSNARAIIARANGLLKDEAGTPAPNLPPETFASRDSDLIACEVECRRDGIEGLFVELDCPGLSGGPPG